MGEPASGVPPRSARRALILGSARPALIDFGKLITEQTDRWAKVIRAANIKPD